MGLSAGNLNIILSLYKNKLFSGFKDVIELGSQNLQADGDDLAFIINKISDNEIIKNSTIKNAKDFYLSLGFLKYNCIDPDQRHDSLNLDLNENLSNQGFSKKYELITNFGTSEHCFDQNNCFTNIHNLCEVGGIMIHGVPFQGALNEGLINYQPNFFFCLASANNYEILGTYINLNGSAGDLIPYSEGLMNVLNLPSSAKETTSIIIALKKLSDDPFNTPWNSKYIGVCNFEKYSFQKTTEIYLPMPSKELSTWNHFSILMKRIKQFGIFTSLKRFLSFKK